MNSLYRVFVYGTLKHGEPNHCLLQNENNGYAKFLGVAKTATKYPLVIATKYNIPFLLKQPGDGHHVVGEVYEVNSNMLKKLDELEDHPSFYVRTECDVNMEDLPESESSQNSRLTKAWIYFLPKFRPSLLNLSKYACYSSKGSHGLEYQEWCKRDPSSEEASLSDVL